MADRSCGLAINAGHRLSKRLRAFSHSTLRSPLLVNLTGTQEASLRRAVVVGSSAARRAVHRRQGRAAVLRERTRAGRDVQSTHPKLGLFQRGAEGSFGALQSARHFSLVMLKILSLNHGTCDSVLSVRPAVAWVRIWTSRCPSPVSTGSTRRRYARLSLRRLVRSYKGGREDRPEFSTSH